MAVLKTNIIEICQEIFQKSIRRRLVVETKAGSRADILSGIPPPEERGLSVAADCWLPRLVRQCTLGTNSGHVSVPIRRTHAETRTSRHCIILHKQQRGTMPEFLCSRVRLIALALALGAAWHMPQRKGARREIRNWKLDSRNRKLESRESAGRTGQSAVENQQSKIVR
jgi:hypothetical protein